MEVFLFTCLRLWFDGQWNRFAMLGMRHNQLE